MRPQLAITRVWLITGLVGAMLVQTLTFRSGAQTIQNPGFETPNVFNPSDTNHSYAVNPTGASWVFSSTAGIAANGSSYVQYSPPNPVPEGSQCAFLQTSQLNSSSISQTISIAADNDYTVTFWASLGDVPSEEPWPQAVTVQVDGVTVSSVTPIVGWSNYTSTAIGLPAGNHKLTFSCGTVQIPAALLVDAVGMTPVGTSPLFTYTTNNGAITITGITTNDANAAPFLIIPNTINGLPVTDIGSNAFAGNTNLTGITIGTNVTSIESEAFGSCTGLTNITIPNSVTNIGSYAFDSSGLASVTIPDSVTSLGDHAFIGCYDLTNFTIGTNVTSIADGVFFGTGLVDVTIPNSVTSIGDSAFRICNNLTSITFGTNVASIGHSAFLNDVNLASITIPNSVTNVMEQAFYGCSSLTNVTIGNHVASIGINAFYYCIGLTNLTIPNSVTSIGLLAFYYCSNLGAVYFQGNAPNVGSLAFSGDPVTVYYVPGTMGWGAFASSTGINPVPWPSGVQYTASPVSAPVGRAIRFTCPGIDTNGIAITNWSWNFGDGAASTNQNPTHIYTATGAFIPIVFAVNHAGTLFPGSGPAITISPPPAISATSSGTDLMITGTNAFSGLQYRVLTSTNLALPRSQWTPVATNTWSTSSNFSLTLSNAVNPTVPGQFYLLQIP